MVGLDNDSQQAAYTVNSQPPDANRAGGGYDGFGTEVRLANIPNLPGDLLSVDKNDTTDKHAEKYFPHCWLLNENQSGYANGVLCKEQHIAVIKE